MVLPLWMKNVSPLTRFFSLPCSSRSVSEPRAGRRVSQRVVVVCIDKPTPSTYLRRPHQPRRTHKSVVELQGPTRFGTMSRPEGSSSLYLGCQEDRLCSKSKGGEWGLEARAGTEVNMLASFNAWDLEGRWVGLCLEDHVDSGAGALDSCFLVGSSEMNARCKLCLSASESTRAEFPNRET